MTRPAGSPSGDRLGQWCGWVLAGAAALMPVLAWLGPLGFAALASLVGLLCLPALRIRDRDGWLFVPLFALVVWAAGSMLWTPFRPDSLEAALAPKLAAQLVLYWAAVCAAVRATPGARLWALRVFVWGMAGLSVVLILEAVTGAAGFQAIRAAIGDPIRPDLAEVKVANGAYALALFWAPAALAALRIGAPPHLTALFLAGVAAPSLAFGADAPLIALVLGGAAGAALLRWPRLGPKVLGLAAAAAIVAAPGLVWIARETGVMAAAQEAAPLSWAMRLGYWDHALNWIGDHPLRGWGLNASRMFGPGIQLHPHNGALQVWLELGAIGAVAFAAFWAALLSRLSRPRAGLAAAAGAASAVAYLTFVGVSFGVWQEWFVGLGALSLTFWTAVDRQPALSPGVGRNAPVAGRTSTRAPISE